MYHGNYQKEMECRSLTEEQTQWASQHDWFIEVSQYGAIVCRGDDEEGRVYFNDFKKLRAWAGY